MSDSTLEGKVDKLVTDVTEIRIALKGYNGDQGLIAVFQEHCKQNKELATDYYKFKRACIGIFCFLVGSGTLGFGIFKIAGWLG